MVPFAKAMARLHPSRPTSFHPPHTYRYVHVGGLLLIMVATSKAFKGHRASWLVVANDATGEGWEWNRKTELLGIDDPKVKFKIIVIMT